MQNVGTPRFYVNDLTWGQSIGIKKRLTGNSVYMNHTLIDGDPSNPYIWNHTLTTTAAEQSSNLLRFHRPDYYRPNYYAILGHNMASQGVGIRHQYLNFSTESANGSAGDTGNLANIMNTNPQTWETVTMPTWNFPINDGFSISEIPSTNDPEHEYHAVKLTIGYGGGSSYIGKEYNVIIGTIFHGRYYDLPHSPDLKLTMTREMDGVKRIRTKGGNDLVNYKYIKPKSWGTDEIELDYDANNIPPWQLGFIQPGYANMPVYSEGFNSVGDYEYKKLVVSGRKTWDLSFTLMDQPSASARTGQVFPEVTNLHNYEATDPFGEDYSGNTSYDENYGLTYFSPSVNSLYANVIHKTHAGQLPFIFQPDNRIPLNLALCKFDMKSFQFTQTANNVYSVKMKIREVW